jgi:uncharacterized protein (DUF1499 family)
MWLLRWLTHNWTDTDEPGDPAIVPLDLSAPLPEAIAQIEKVIASLSRWRIEHIDAPNGIIKATRRTALWGFIDDVTIRLEAVSGGTRVHARSKSRLGKGDLGQNRRNLLQLFDAIRKS